MATVEQLLEKLTDTVSYIYQEDKISPGVLFSTLKDKQIYASIVRYGTDFHKGKKVVCNVKGTTIKKALDLLVEKFLLTIEVKKNPLDALKQLFPKINKTITQCNFVYSSGVRCGNPFIGDDLCADHYFTVKKHDY